LIALDLGSQLTQPFLVARNQEDTVATSSELAGELRSDAA
jgi:hypothetical protein